MTYMREHLLTLMRAKEDDKVFKLLRDVLKPEQVRALHLFKLTDDVYAHQPVMTSLYINSLILAYVYGGHIIDSNNFLDQVKPVFRPSTPEEHQDYEDFLCHVISDPYLFEHNQRLKIVDMTQLPSRAWGLVATCSLEHESELVNRLIHSSAQPRKDLAFKISDIKFMSHRLFAFCVSVASGYAPILHCRYPEVTLAGTYHPKLYRSLFQVRYFNSLDWLLQLGLTREELVNNNLLAKSLRPKGLTSVDFLSSINKGNQLRRDRLAQLLRDLGYFVPDLIKWWIRSGLDVGDAFNSITLDEWLILERDDSLMSILKTNLMNDSHCCPANISLLLHMKDNQQSCLPRWAVNSTVDLSDHFRPMIPSDNQTTIW
jgi:hypothetical protein